MWPREKLPGLHNQVRAKFEQNIFLFQCYFLNAQWLFDTALILLLKWDFNESFFIKSPSLSAGGKHAENYPKANCMLIISTMCSKYLPRHKKIINGQRRYDYFHVLCTICKLLILTTVSWGSNLLACLPLKCVNIT